MREVINKCGKIGCILNKHKIKISNPFFQLKINSHQISLNTNNVTKLRRQQFRFSLQNIANRYLHLSEAFAACFIKGDSGVGKTCLISRFTKDSFLPEQQPTIGVEFSTRTTRIGDKIIKAQIWDTAGQERYRAITSAYYRGASGAMVVFDVSKNTSFENLSKWLKELREHSDLQIIPMLIGNKSDLTNTRLISTDQASKFAEENEMAYLETSALQNSNVEKAFSQLIQYIHNQTANGGSQRKSFTTKQSKNISMFPLDKNQKDFQQKDNSCC